MAWNDHTLYSSLTHTDLSPFAFRLSPFAVCRLPFDVGPLAFALQVLAVARSNLLEILCEEMPGVAPKPLAERRVYGEIRGLGVLQQSFAG